MSPDNKVGEFLGIIIFAFAFGAIMAIVVKEVIGGLALNSALKAIFILLLDFVIGSAVETAFESAIKNAFDAEMFGRSGSIFFKFIISIVVLLISVFF
jgi:hypothetical protein